MMMMKSGVSHSFLLIEVCYLCKKVLWFCVLLVDYCVNFS
jgi:hypothetical protein